MDTTAISKSGTEIGTKRQTSSTLTQVVSNRHRYTTAAVHSHPESSTSNDSLFDRKVEIASEGLSSYYSTCIYKILLKENALTLASYIISLKSEMNPSSIYRREIIDKLSRFSVYCDKTLFKDITREQILDFLDNGVNS
jgi:hypothetical protein